MKITINPLDPKSVAAAAKQLEQYWKEFEQKEAEFIRRLAEIGVSVARAGFAMADYDGTKDVVVSLEKTKDGMAVVASGKTVGFIEFGTGIKYPEWVDNNHTNGRPYIPKPHGTYGKKQGMNEYGWWFKESDGAKARHTYGNYPAMAMLSARDEVVDRITQIAREVWR